MKKLIPIIVVLIVVIIGLSIYFISKNNNENNVNQSTNENKQENSTGEESVEKMQIQVSDGNNIIIYELNNSDAARSLYEQLPLTIEVENFSSNEKIFYPTNELDVSNTPSANGGDAGILAYYEPWGDVVMFYDSFSSASGLYELGTAINGVNQISNLSGEITIERIEN